MVRMTRVFGVAFSFSLLGAMTGAAQQGPRTPGFWAAAGAGGGLGKIACDACLELSRESAGFGTVSFGWTVSPRLDLEADASGWIRPGDRTTARLSQVLVGARYYPTKKGLFVGAATGWSRYLQEPKEDEAGSMDRIAASGLALRGSVGWAVRLGPAWSVVPSVSYLHGFGGSLTFNGLDSGAKLTHSVVAAAATVEWRFAPIP